MGSRHEVRTIEVIISIFTDNDSESKVYIYIYTRILGFRNEVGHIC